MSCFISTIVTPFGANIEQLKTFLSANYGGDKDLFSIRIVKENFIGELEQVAKTHHALTRNGIPNRFIVVGPLKDTDYEKIMPFSEGILYWNLDIRHQHPVNPEACLKIQAPANIFDFQPVSPSWKRPASEMSFEERGPKRSGWDSRKPLPEFIDIPRDDFAERVRLPTKFMVRDECEIMGKSIFSLDSRYAECNIEFIEMTDIRYPDGWKRPTSKFIKVFNNRIYVPIGTRFVRYCKEERNAENYRNVRVYGKTCCYWNPETFTIMY